MTQTNAGRVLAYATAAIIFQWRGDKAAGDLGLFAVKRWGQGWQLIEPAIPIATIQPTDAGLYRATVRDPRNPEHVALSWEIGTRKNAVSQCNDKVRRLMSWCEVAFVPLSVGRPRGAKNVDKLEEAE
jgi:hypothetical protein